MVLDDRFLDISFNHVFKEITASLKMDLEDMKAYFQENEVEIDPNIIDEWKKEALPESRQFKTLIEYIEVRAREFKDIGSIHSTAKKLREYINCYTLVPLRDKAKLISIKESIRFLIVVLIKAYDYQIYNNTPQQQLENFIDFINKNEQYQPEVFISYSWDSPQHKKDVSLFAVRLKKAHIKVLYDKDLKFGQKIDRFMNKIKFCDYVLVICTPSYKEKADNHLGGVGDENEIIIQELIRAENEYKFIPVLFAGTWETSLPKWANSRLGVDLRPSADAVIEEGKLIEQLCVLTLADQ